MVGPRKEKVHCGAVLPDKACMRCHEGIRREPGTCPRCKAPLVPWCETWVNPGARCAKHADRELFPQHAEAPVDFHDSIAAAAGPTGRAFNAVTESMSLAEMAAEMARTMMSRAMDAGDAKTAGEASRALENAVRMADIERKAKALDPLAAGNGHITINVRRMELPERRPAPPPPEDE